MPALPFDSSGKLQGLLVGLDHLLDHLAAHGAGLAAGEVAVVALLQVDANLPWCTSSSLSASNPLRHKEFQNLKIQ